ncbi:zf-TFIIB domain-containing protein [Sporolactobacillus shoreicorticis]|uniref:Zf-TFIIB domain-containing protein n=1 Tax=Sporolactobacillus shoreicorticis TaxID=1923877 RepID=A0ABW5RY56_9BACL|nr:zf-TFIIB domain-containing protein [Sporolactobacillus shoreicorticis]MCO7124965.1 zf-TFIIB domain-containing protein [Sporolactobacillus shoreicorticis]
MFCPVCDDVRIKEIEKEGVLIDTCPNCKGIWLDRGELDKLSTRVKEVHRPFNDWYGEDQQKSYRDRDYKDNSYYDKRKGEDYVPHRKKKKSVMDMLGDIFD